MKRFVEGLDRSQTTLFPDCVDDFVGEDDPVRAIDVSLTCSISPRSVPTSNRRPPAVLAIIQRRCSSSISTARLRAGRHRRHRLQAAHLQRRSGRGASTEPTSSIMPRRMPTCVRPASCCPITTRTSRTARRCGTAGRTTRGLRRQAQVHDGQGAPRETLGARGHPRARPETPRR